MSFAPSLACRRCGHSIPRDGDRAYRCPQCGDRRILTGGGLDV